MVGALEEQWSKKHMVTVKGVDDLLFKEERQKWQDNGGKDMLINHNNQSADATGSQRFYQDQEYWKSQFI